MFSLIPGYDPVATASPGEWFDEDEADRRVEFFSDYLVHIEASTSVRVGDPFILEPWQQAHVGCAFGWKRDNGTRRYREVFDYEPRKNGKTCKAGGLILNMLFCDGEPGAQIYSAAADHDQASLVFRQAYGMLKNASDLAELSKVYTAVKSIVIESVGSFYKVISSDAETKHGFNSHFIIVDEVHAHHSRDLIDVLVTSTGSRIQPMIWYITTADYFRPSICNEKYQYACKVRDGVIQDSSFLPIVYECLPTDDWTSPDMWRKANPNLGISISEEYMHRECLRAKEVPSYENIFKRLHLNIITEQSDRWIPLSHWDECNTPVSSPSLMGRSCFGGLDMANTSDLASLVLVFPNADGSYDVLPYFWCPRGAADKRQSKNQSFYFDWERQGFLELTSEDSIDYAHIRKRINEIGAQFKIHEIAFDPWNATQLATELAEQDGFSMIQMRQGTFTMNEPSKEFERLVMTKKLKHGGNPVLRWMVSNVSIKPDEAGNIKPDKKKSGDKIDGVVAAIMAIGRGMLNKTIDDEVSIGSGIRFL